MRKSIIKDFGFSMTSDRVSVVCAHGGIGPVHVRVVGDEIRLIKHAGGVNGTRYAAKTALPDAWTYQIGKGGLNGGWEKLHRRYPNGVGMIELGESRAIDANGSLAFPLPEPEATHPPIVRAMGVHRGSSAPPNRSGNRGWNGDSAPRAKAPSATVASPPSPAPVSVAAFKDDIRDAVNLLNRCAQTNPNFFMSIDANGLLHALVEYGPEEQ